MSNLKFSPNHEWIEVDGDIGTVGITDFAQSQLGDIVYVETPDKGEKLSRGDGSALVESVKAASEVIAIVSGEVEACNEDLIDNPALVNKSPEGDAWFYKIRLSDPSELDDLMDEDAYRAFIGH